MKVSPRPLTQETPHTRASKHSTKTHMDQKSQNTYHNWKGKDRNDFLERYSNSKSTIILPEKKINRSNININNFNETTLNSQLLLESVCRESESRSRGKLSERGNSKETTMVTTQSMTSIPNKQVQVPSEVQLRDLRALYEIKEIEAQKLLESNNIIKNKVEQASDYIGKHKQVHNLINNQERIINQLKGNLAQVTNELEELKMRRKSAMVSNNSGISNSGSQSARESKKILIRRDSSSSKISEKNPSEMKFKMYLDAVNKNELGSSLKLKIPSSIENKHSKIHVSGPQSARRGASEQNDNDNYLLNEHFGRKVRAQALTARTEYKPTSQTQQDTQMQFLNKKWPVNDSWSDLKKFYSEYQDLSKGENSSDITQKVRTIKNSHVSHTEHSNVDIKPKQNIQPPSGLTDLISKFAKLLDKYEKSEQRIQKRNKELERKLATCIKKETQNK